MECKEKSSGLSFSGKTCINRNIVECKVELVTGGDEGEQCINRNIVECKAGNLDSK